MDQSNFVKLANRGTPFKGFCYRSVAPKYATQKDVLSVKGSIISGGRYNSQGLFGVLYLACDHHTCNDEATRGIQDAAFIAEIYPRVIISVEVKLSNVLDLTDPENLSEIGITKSDLTGPGWEQPLNNEEPITQMIGRLAKEAKFEALLVPSARSDEGKNLDIFPDNISSYRVIKSDELPET